MPRKTIVLSPPEFGHHGNAYRPQIYKFSFPHASLTRTHTSLRQRAASSSRTIKLCEQKSVLAVDVGTTDLKACVVLQDGTVLGQASAGYQSGTYVGLNGEVEQHPKDWMHALSRAGALALARASGVSSSSRNFQDITTSVDAVVLSGQMQNLIPVRDGAALRSALLYSDTRARREFQVIEDCIGVGRLRTESTNVKGAASVLAKWLWLHEREPELCGGAERLLLGAHSFLAYALTAGAAARTDRTTASTTGLLAPAGAWHESVWCAQILKDLGLPECKLPELADACSAVGRVDARVARDAGLACLAGVPVFHGVGDLGSTVLGAGAPNHMYIGTSGWIACQVPEDAPACNRPGVFSILHPQSGSAIRAASMVSAGGAVEWLRELLWANSISLSDLDKAAASAPIGAGGLLFLPHLNGERSPFTDPSARGAFLGLSGATSRSHMARAVLEGIAFNFRSIAESLEPTLPPASASNDTPALPFVGGGAKSVVWSQIVADVLGRKLLLMPSAAQVAARGCASLAFKGMHAWADDKAPDGFFSRATSTDPPVVVDPDPSNTEFYNKLFVKFTRQYPALKAADAFSRTDDVLSQIENHV